MDRIAEHDRLHCRSSRLAAPYDAGQVELNLVHYLHQVLLSWTLASVPGESVILEQDPWSIQREREGFPTGLTLLKKNWMSAEVRVPL